MHKHVITFCSEVSFLWQPFFWEDRKKEKATKQPKMDQSQSSFIFILFCDWLFAESEKVAKYILRWYIEMSAGAILIS